MNNLTNPYNLKSINDIQNNLKNQLGIIINQDDKYYRQLMLYDKLYNYLILRPEIITKSDLYHIKNIIEELIYDKNINCVIRKDILKISTLKNAFLQLYEALNSDSDMKSQKYTHDIMANIRNNAYILPIVIAATNNYSNIKAKPNNRYETNCTFNNGISYSLSILENEHYWHAFNSDIANGNVIDFLTKFTSLNYLESAETLAKAYDIELPKNVKTNENIEWVNRIKNVLENKKYLKMIRTSFRKTVFAHPDMSTEDISYTYNFKHISK